MREYGPYCILCLSFTVDCGASTQQKLKSAFQLHFNQLIEHCGSYPIHNRTDVVAIPGPNYQYGTKQGNGALSDGKGRIRTDSNQKGMKCHVTQFGHVTKPEECR